MVTQAQLKARHENQNDVEERVLEAIRLFSKRYGRA